MYNFAIAMKKSVNCKKSFVTIIKNRNWGKKCNNKRILIKKNTITFLKYCSTRNCKIITFKNSEKSLVVGKKSK